MTCQPKLRTRVALTLLATVFAVACDTSADLQVDLITDITPGYEWVRVEVVVGVDPPDENPSVRRSEVFSTEIGERNDLRFAEGVPIVRFNGLSPGEYWLVATLYAPDGRALVSEPKRFFLDAGLNGQTVRLFRDCIDVECPGSGPPGNLACLAGQCVDPRCGPEPEAQQYCPPVSCEADGDCAPPGIACADVRCITGTCFTWSMSERCPDEAYCSPDSGCVAVDPGPVPEGCPATPCDTGDECQLGRLSCDEGATCEPIGVAFPGSACERGECDEAGGCVGFPLDVTIDGPGRVTSDPARVVCTTGTCRSRFSRGRLVTLSASSETGELVGWSGDCESVEDGACLVSMEGARAVTAEFDLADRLVRVEPSGGGTGRIVSSPVGIDCGSTCESTFPHGTELELTAIADPGQAFAGFGGDCAHATGSTCTVVVDGPLVIGATFVAEDATVLTVRKVGTGQGTVTSTPAGIDCGSTCAMEVTPGAMVTLVASALPGSTFGGWTGAGACAMSTTCVVSVADSMTVDARFTRERHTLIVERTGDGAGTVTSTLSAIDCGTDCMAEVDGGTPVTLYAAPADGSDFDGWEGTSCGMAAECTFTMTGPRTVQARFVRSPVRLSITRDGAGTGRVVSTPAGIDCPGSCQADFAPGVPISLQATPSTGSVWAGWSGLCAGQPNPCSLTLEADTSVRATFQPAMHLLQVTRTGDGVGTVASSPAGIACGSTCSASFVHDTLVTLTPTPAMGSQFAGWGGACTGMTCTVNMTQVRDVTASFTVSSHLVSVSRLGDGDGSVVSMDGAIDCGGTCSASYTSGSLVSLVAIPEVGSTFTGWSGACTGIGACEVTVNGTVSVSATFERDRHSLSVVREGSGSVRSTEGSINCGDICEAMFAHGETVVLEATPEAGWTFQSWSDASCGANPSCEVLVTGATGVTARFGRSQRRITITLTGEGLGAVQSSVEIGIDCHPGGGTCSVMVADGAEVLLRTYPEDGSQFGRWTGAPGCTTSPECMFTVTSDLDIEARFDRASGGELCRLDVDVVGLGLVTEETGGIRCPDLCSATYRCGERLQLLATDNPDRFSSWGGCDTVEENICHLVISEPAMSVRATFGSVGE